MAATTTDIETLARPGEIVAYPVATKTAIPKGVLVQLASGYATSMTKGENLIFCGVSIESVDNTGGGNGDKVIRCARKGIHELILASAAVTDVGATVYALDNQTVSKTSTGATSVGRAAKFENTGKIFIDIGGSC